ncbi:MAG: preprotein translocase subunit SecE [Gemmatimonadetes bacterium]|nr:preprotein translocase subunit SecE [Gemmatimonadota bacterium]
MAVEVVPQQGVVQKTVAFYHDVMAELKRVTWPDMPQVRQLSVGVVLLSVFIGGVIALMDVVLQQLLVRLPSAF